MSSRCFVRMAVMFREWLDAEQPDRAHRVMSLLRQMRGGKDYDARWNTRMRGEGPMADLIRQRFAKAKVRYGYSDHQQTLRTDLFRRPPRPGDQIDLFAG